MLPSRPNTGGLPSGPRSRSVGRPPRQPEDSHRRDQTQSRSDAPPRQVRSQRSMASFPSAPTRSRSRPPPMPESRQPNTRAPQSRRYDASVYETQSDAGGSHRSSGASAASSGSSLFDRIKGGGGYASSRTSFDDEEDDQTRKHRDPVDNRGRSLRSRRLAQSEPPSPQEYEPETNTPSTDTGTGDGYTIWSRVASAAGGLTVSVSKAWASNIATYAGEETPPGQESRLTRAMKAYHLEKARSPTDLPTWLFDEHERRPPPPPPTSKKSRRDDDDEYEVVERNVSEPPRARGLRDVYAAAATTKSAAPVRQDRPSQRVYADDPPSRSKATDRLKALRDAKRSAFNPNPSRLEDESEPEPDVGSRRETPASAAPRRVGLPSGPLPRSRRV